MSIQAYLAAVPKAELHVHLEGSILPATLLTLAERNGIDLPATTVDGLRELFAFRDFDHFIEIYGIISRCLKTTEDFETIAYEFGTEMARQHALYAEVTFTPSFHHHHGHPDSLFLDGLERGRQRARNEFGVEMRWVFDIIRNVSDPALNAKYADYTTSLAIDCMERGVISLGLGGGEAGYPPEPFEPYFTRAKAAGLHSDPHAGEVAGPESVWGALRSLGAERIGHGVRSIEDPKLVAYLAEHQIPIEVNPTSNICLGVYPNLGAHPLRKLYEAGVPLSVNSDDPPLFNTTLNDEVMLLAGEFDFDVATIDDILLNGVRHSFLPAEQKAALEKRFREEMEALKRDKG
jgi:adenosine deaminase